MLDIKFIVIILALHFIGDFLLQSDRMSKNKSKSLRWLSAHICVYTLALTPLGLTFAMVNGFAHLCIDYGTSKATSRLWEAKKTHWFFVVIGADQLVHYALLFWTYTMLA